MMIKARIAAGVVAAAVVAGSVGLVAVNGKPAKVNETAAGTYAEQYGYEYSLAQGLYFKINELWRLSINSDLPQETVEAISVLNSGFDIELLMNAVKAEGSDVVDEYIYSVLAGLDFELYLTDRPSYDSAKSEAAYSGEVLTEEKIDEYLNQLNKRTAQGQVEEALGAVPEVKAPGTEIKQESPSAGPDVPTAESLLPENPAEAVKRETEALLSGALPAEAN